MFLYGHALVNKHGLWNRGPRSWKSLAADVGWCLFLLWLGSSYLIYITAPVLAILVVTIAGEVWVRWGNHGNRLVQVRLGPEGLRQMNRGGGGMPFDRNIRRTPIPWSDARRVQLVSSKRDRLQLLIVSTWWHLREHVHAEVVCTHEQAAALAARISQWAPHCPVQHDLPPSHDGNGA